MNRRTSFVTAAAITGTVLAGTTAVAANIGILNSAESSPIGDLNATADVNTTTAPEPQVIDVYVDEPVPVTPVPTTAQPEPAPMPAPAPDPVQQYTVDVAGTVSVVQTADGLRLGGVQAVDGWAWESSQSSAAALVVTFTSGDRTFVFTAAIDADGTIAASVDEPIVRTIQVPAASGSSGSSGSSAASSAPAGGYDDDEDDREDDREHESEYESEHEDGHESEHAGGEDDD